MTALDQLVEVRVLELPLDLYERAQAHTDGLLREFRLLLEQSRDHESDVPARLLQLVTTLTATYSGFTDAQDQLLEDAVARRDTVYPELVFQVPAEVAQACAVLEGMLDETDAYCQDGQLLLMLATPAELVHFRTWYLEEFVRQIAGQAPTPWPAYRDARLEAEGE